MAGLPKALARAKAPLDSAPTVVTVPASKRWIITNIVMTNSGTATVTASMAIDGVPIISNAQLGANGILTLDCAQVLEAGKGFSYSSNTANALNVHISGVEMDA